MVLGDCNSRQGILESDRLYVTFQTEIDRTTVGQILYDGVEILLHSFFFFISLFLC